VPGQKAYNHDGDDGTAFYALFVSYELVSPRVRTQKTAIQIMFAAVRVRRSYSYASERKKREKNKRSY